MGGGGGTETEKEQKKKKTVPFRENVLECIRPFPGPIPFFMLGAVDQFYWAIQRSWFARARVNALCNLSRKKSREVTAHFRADF